MTLSIGDHLVIMRDGNIIMSEGHHEYEVVEQVDYSTEGEGDGMYTAVSVGKLKVIK